MISNQNLENIRQIFAKDKPARTNYLLHKFHRFWKKYSTAYTTQHSGISWDIMAHHKNFEYCQIIVPQFYCRTIICRRELSNAFRIDTEVEQGCILSPFLFLLPMDWIMKDLVIKEKTRIRWTFSESLRDQVLPNDIVLLSQIFMGWKPNHKSWQRLQKRQA